jgi:regulatory protein
LANDAYISAIRYLAQREHSVMELVQKLSRKGFDEPEIQQAISQLQAENKQCDQRFAESLMRARVQAGKGPRWLEQELQQHNLPVSMLGELDVDWSALAVQARAKRFGLQPVQEQSEKARQVRFLQYRGFTSQQIHLALQAIDGVE